MKSLLAALVALSLLAAPPALAQGFEPDPPAPSQVPVMMELVRMIMREAREGRLEQLMPRQDQLRGLEGVLRPDQDGFALPEELFRAVQLTPEQQEQMRGFRLSQDQLFAMLELVMERGIQTRPQDLDPFLTAEQQQMVDNLQLTPEQLEAMQRLLSEHIGPMAERLQGRAADLPGAVELSAPQLDFLQMLFELADWTRPRQ